MEVNVLFVNKQSLNSGTIIFDSYKTTKKWIETLIKLKIGFIPYVIIADGRKYYTIKMFRFKRQFLEMCVKLKEVLNA